MESVGRRPTGDHGVWHLIWVCRGDAESPGATLTPLIVHQCSSPCERTLKSAGRDQGSEAEFAEDSRGVWKKQERLIAIRLHDRRSQVDEVRRHAQASEREPGCECGR